DSASPHILSPSSTPPTAFSSDTISVASDTSKAVLTPAPEIEARIEFQSEAAANCTTVTVAGPVTVSGRARRSCVGTPTYNLAQLSGGFGQRKRRSTGDHATDRKRRNISDAAPLSAADPQQPDTDAAQSAAGGATSIATGSVAIPQTRQQSTKNAETSENQSPNSGAIFTPRTTRASARLNGDVAAPGIVAKAATLGKRSRQALSQGLSSLSRELRRLQDTNEFAHVDTQPVIHTIWANGKLVTPEEAEKGPAAKKAKTEASSSKKGEDGLEVHTRKGRRTKHWLDKGLYAGQETPSDPSQGLTPAEKKKMAQIPNLKPSGRINKALPLPIFNGMRLLIQGRDFKLPFDVCNPLPPGQPKPEHWTRISKNRFVGESGLLWKKNQHSWANESKCVCKPKDRCGDDCQNRIMLYECDEKNCNIGKDLCTNRAFAHLQERKAAGGKYRTGVEVIKTSDRGYGVRANRCFEPNQIIMEYTGEIITEEECENRMNSKYKKNDCYYLMSFDQNMIIDATNGSIARFVNHSCKPNCKMVKWIVGCQPRMALFAGDQPIMTGDELTYDYNFDPFSAKNVQTCLCGEENCRGVLGPKPKEKDCKAKAAKDAAAKTVKDVVKGVVKAGKRKLEELVGDKNDADGSASKRRKTLTPANAQKKATTTTKATAAKAATTFKKSCATPKRTASTVIKRKYSSASARVSKMATKGADTVKKGVST
ncbi:hypothetical protein ACRALDRAFT_1011064, partial [Sodiomyces alcalophilus JCM 7366]|uniref:uncharacterized protein n=1 Tax=Sodiomyces alcalophilus JCM 7366 TaxID=591952 RepID=UPI0039B390C7